MLIEIWERLRGYDRWTETTAIVETSDLVNKGSQFRISGTTPVLSSRARIAWTDARGRKRTAEFEVDDESRLYQLVGAETVTIRYNPAKPQQYYFRDLLRSRLSRLSRIALFSLLRIDAR